MIAHLNSLWTRFVGSLGSLRNTRVILDRHRRLNHPARRPSNIDTTINKEEESRRVLFEPATLSGRFLEIGCGKGDLNYLLGIRGNFDFDQQLQARNLELFQSKFDYCGIDLAEQSAKNILAGDVCSPDFPDRYPDLLNACAVVYSNNVFEHLRQPWIAARNIGKLIAPRGVCITIVPFAQRYHESPGDYFRYTHKGLESLFESAMKIEVIRSGYDILGRRNDWQGSGQFNDSVPVDEFGAWRETWFTFLAFRKVGEL